ncbi:MAG: GAF domain-containing sensor histidine kinase [Chloroflexales bacterium]|nr:GAF domain-containing sensor histidine kinase [Chloroflexales bacterium]
MVRSGNQNQRHDRWQRIGGERLYTFARWLVVAILIGISPLLSRYALLPLTLESGSVVILIWIYIGFSLLMTLALFVPLLDPLLKWSFLFDVAFITTMVVLNDERNGVFFSLYVLPLIGTATQLRSITSLLSGTITALAYSGAYLVSLSNTGVPAQPLDYAALGLRALAITFMPWFTSNMAERWSDNNRRRVDQAQLQTEEALRDAQSHRDQMRSLYEVAYTLSTTMNYQKVLESALLESHKLVPYVSGLVLLSTGKTDELYVAATRPTYAGDQGRHLMVGKGAIGTALRSGNATLINAISQEPELVAIGALRACHTAYVIPLRAQLRTYGLMVIAGDRPNAFRREQLDMLTALANYAIIALHNAQLLIDLKEERTKLISKEEEVRRQLARDLHDGPAQALAAITMNAEFIKRLLERDPSRVGEEIDKLGALAKRTTHEVRTMLFELRPLVLETQGLRVTLEQYLERFQTNNNGTQILLETRDTEEVTLDTKTEGTLFNIIQEAINNALKHAKARHIYVSLKREGEMLTATIQDDGKGFDLVRVMQSYEKRGSFGLLNIDERARLVGGMAELHSAPGEGTTVRVVVPFEA